MEEILYKSTRDSEKRIKASEAILKGLSDDGGLFMPEHIPSLDKTIEELSNMNYKEIAYEVLKLYYSDFTKEELEDCINKAYDKKFDTEEIVPIVEKDGMFYLELFHGATIAFKDMALSILPHLMTTAAKKNNVSKEIVILAATSGDTGKAALSGFSDVKGTRIVAFYPKGGVSFIQERQMLTQKGDNTCVVGIKGNFDDAQTGVKKIFSDKDFAKELEEAGFQLSSANSINIGRLIPQVVYYVYANAKLYKEGKVSEGEQINVVVPTGNFGNILAAFFAKNMGIPIAKLICASNENKVLYDFFETGVYDRNREFILTNSPSMDILISSNLERLIYMLCDCNSDMNRDLMNKLTSEGKYEITSEMKDKLISFTGGYASIKETNQTIKDMYDKTGYVLDTHTAVATCVYKKYVEKTNDNAKTIIASTASPYKFTNSVLEAIEGEKSNLDDFAQVDKLSEISKVKIPNAIEEIKIAEIRHNKVAEKENMKDAVKEFLNI